ncbi:MAG: hypothetical protein LBO05_04390 [Deltaproteobacteria bacterium]|jgi:hypothetical protein|nr:hypothetical protein [Deltaproteobacteria bacterium]
MADLADHADAPGKKTPAGKKEAVRIFKPVARAFFRVVFSDGYFFGRILFGRIFIGVVFQGLICGGFFGGGPPR